MKIGDRVLYKKNGEYGIVLEVTENKDKTLSFDVLLDNGDLIKASFRELYKINCLKTV